MSSIQKFVPNPAAPAALEATAAMAAMLERRAQMAATRAQEIAPRQTGDYADSIEGVSVFEGGKAKGRILARDFKAGWIEFGTWKWPAHATLRRAAEATGLRLTGKGRR